MLRVAEMFRTARIASRAWNSPCARGMCAGPSVGERDGRDGDDASPSSRDEEPSETRRDPPAGAPRVLLDFLVRDRDALPRSPFSSSPPFASPPRDPGASETEASASTDDGAKLGPDGKPWVPPEEIASVAFGSPVRYPLTRGDKSRGYPKMNVAEMCAEIRGRISAKQMPGERHLQKLVDKVTTKEEASAAAETIAQFHHARVRDPKFGAKSRLSGQSMNMFVSACERSGNVTAAVEALEMHNVLGFRLTKTVCVKVLRFVESAEGELALTMRVYRTMREGKIGLGTDGVIVNLIVRAAVRAKAFEVARDWLKKFADAAVPVHLKNYVAVMQPAIDLGLATFVIDMHDTMTCKPPNNAFSLLSKAMAHLYLDEPDAAARAFEAAVEGAIAMERRETERAGGGGGGDDATDDVDPHRAGHVPVRTSFARILEAWPRALYGGADVPEDAPSSSELRRRVEAMLRGAAGGDDRDGFFADVDAMFEGVSHGGREDGEEETEEEGGGEGGGGGGEDGASEDAPKASP